MKQAADKFTIDAFGAPRRGRPPLLNAKSAAQRQAEYKSRQRKAAKSSDPKVMAEFQRKQLAAMSAKLLAFSCDWGDVDEWFRSRLEELSFEVLGMTEQFDLFLSAEDSSDLEE